MLYNYPTTCKEPERLSDKMWDMVSSTEFACKVGHLLILVTTVLIAARNRGFQGDDIQPARL